MDSKYETIFIIRLLRSLYIEGDTRKGWKFIYIIRSVSYQIQPAFLHFPSSTLPINQMDATKGIIDDSLQYETNSLWHCDVVRTLLFHLLTSETL